MHIQIKSAMEQAIEEGVDCKDSMRIMVETAAGFEDFDCTGLEEAIERIFDYWGNKSELAMGGPRHS